MSLNITIKDWFARNAGTDDCFVSSGIAYTDPDNISRTGGTGDVVNAFVVAHLLAKDTQIIIAGANYNDLKAINNNTDMTIDDVSWAYNNDGSPVGEPQYCIAVAVLTSIQISPVTASISIGSTEQLSAVCKDQNNNVMPCPTLSWLSSDDLIATVNQSGLVTGIVEGSVAITASYGTIASNTSTITVGTAPEPASILIFPESATIGIDKTVQLSAVCKDQYDDTIDCLTLTWSSIDDTVATVDSSGKVTGIKEGMTNITASDGTITSNASTITVTEVKEAGINPMLIAGVIGLGLLAVILKD